MTNPTKRRRFRFSLRTLLIVVVLLSVGFGWFALKMRQAERQRKAVQAIREAGGDVYYDYQWNGKGSIRMMAEPPGPAWLRELVGEDFTSDVTCVYLGNTADDRALENLKVLTTIKSLDLINTRNTDAGLEQIRGLPQLKHLRLSGPQLTDAGLEHIRGLTQLTYLVLIGPQFTDAGLEHIKGLAELKQLQLSGPQFTDAGLEHLKGLTNLIWLDLSKTQVTDAGLENLKGMMLQNLFLSDTKATEKGVGQLRESLPSCYVEWIDPSNIRPKLTPPPNADP